MSDATPPHSRDQHDERVQKSMHRSETSALASAKRNLSYLYDPKSAPHAPARLRTRALLRATRSLLIFAFWRLVRYGRYVAAGLLVSALGATAFGSAISGVGFLLAPPTMGAAAGVGVLWAVGRYGYRMAADRVRRGRDRKGARTGEEDGDEGIDTMEVPEPKTAMDAFA